MINVCNIFKAIDPGTNGAFLLFSNYTDDIARSTSDSGYRVRPSRFFCLNSSDLLINNAHSILNNGDSSNINGNTDIPRYFQNIFENSLSAMRNKKLDDKYPSDFNYSADFIYQFSRLFTRDSSLLLNTYIVYDDKIDLQSFEDGFADIILNIPSGAKKKNYVYKEGITSLDELGGLIGTCTYDIPDYIYGWNSTSSAPPLDGTVSTNLTVGTGESLQEDNESIFDKILTSTQNSESFSFNTILICYDIEYPDGYVMYKDIPMGIYFTGVDGGNFTNPVTIYKGDDNTLGVGSSWSLRICTRYAPTPNGVSVGVEKIAVDSGLKTVSSLLAANAELIKTINNFSQQSWVNSQSYRDLLNMFKNSQTNVPYPHKVNDVNYWFVNGRNTEIPCTVKINS